MGFLETAKSIPGLKHYYPLNATYQLKDAVGGINATNVGGVAFTNGRAKFTGSNYLELPDHNDFSVGTTGGLTLVAFLTIDNWARTIGSNARVYWAGKYRQQGELEWTMCHYYSPDQSGENRPKRVSVYHNNLTSYGAGGVGHYFQDATLAAGTEVMVTATWNRTPFYIDIYRDGVLRGHQTNPQAPDARNAPLTFTGTAGGPGPSPVRLGKSNDTAGSLVGQLRRVGFYSRALTAAEIKKLWDARAQAEEDVAATGPTGPTGPTGSTGAATGATGAIDPYTATGTTDVVAKHNELVKALKGKGIV